MTALLQAAQELLDALGEIMWSNDSKWQSNRVGTAITVLRQALKAEQQSKPVAWLWFSGGKPISVTFGGPNNNTPKDWEVCPLYTHSQTEPQSQAFSHQPNRNVQPPQYQCVTEGYDPRPCHPGKWK